MLAITGLSDHGRPGQILPDQGIRPLSIGTYIYILYSAEPELWHERLILGRFGKNSAYLVMTPDGDAYAEWLDSEDFITFRVGNKKR